MPTGDPGGWNHEPLSADLSDGFIHGRGAIDDKGRTAINPASIVSLHRDPSPSDVLFVAAADEEEGGALGVRWLMDSYPETLDADFALGEGGAGTARRWEIEICIPTRSRRKVLSASGSPSGQVLPEATLLSEAPRIPRKSLHESQWI